LSAAGGRWRAGIGEGRPRRRLLLTADGPLGAEIFLYFRSVPEPFALQLLAGSVKLTGPLPSSKLSRVSPVDRIGAGDADRGVFRDPTNVGVLLSSSFLPLMA
jgi:hypothetical protein